MGFLDDGLFDFDGNGKTTEDEEFAAIATLAFLKAQEEQKKNDTSRDARRYVPSRSLSKPASPAQTTAAASTEEQDEVKEPGPKRTWIGWIVIGLFAAIIAGLIINNAVKSAKMEAAYRNAETLIAQEDYGGALQLLGKLDPSYQDVKPLSRLCEAHLTYDRGGTIDAYFMMKGESFRHQTPEQMAKIEAFRDKLKREYDAYIEAQAEERQAEYERIQALPFPSVGQYVTSAQYEHMTYQRGDSHTCSKTTEVYYYVSGDDAYYLWISDNDEILYLHEVTIKGGSKTGGKSSSHAYDPDVDGFTDPDDFYEWYKDDFSDYEDAEEYYYDHGGE